jgi:CubicO group peptidase (beta-lactamase class C family)
MGERAARRIPTLATLLVAALGLTAAGPPETMAQEARATPLGARLDSLVRATVPFGFAGQVVVEVDGRVVLDGAYGYADAAARRPMTRETRLGVASVSKQFAAAAVMSLVEAGRLSTSDTLGRFFPDAPPDKRGITLEQLLTHTSGVRTTIREDFEAKSLDELVGNLMETPLAFEPSTRWAYSTEGYNLVAAIVQQVSGRPYGEYLRERLFEPAGLAHTSLLDGARTGDVAEAYLAWDDRGSPHSWPHNWRNFGAGDVVTTAEDLHRWDVALREGRILRSVSVERMTTSHAEVQDGVGYGYGFFINHADGEPRMIEHGGDAELGYNASYFRYVDEGFVVIITCNRRSPDGVSLRHALGLPIERMLRGQEREPPPGAELLEPDVARRLAGTYELPDGSYLYVIFDGVRPWIAADGQAAVELLAGTDSLAPNRVLVDRRTAELMDGLLAGADLTAYATALDSAGAPYLDDYVGEWRELVASKGPLQAYRIAGSVSDERTALTRATLRFRDGVTTMSFFWSEGGRGRLAGTNVEATPFRPPAVFPLGRAPDGLLVGWDPIGEHTVRLSVSAAGNLELRGPDGSRVAAKRRGALGWLPPFRP